jgi:hypothetical protein
MVDRTGARPARKPFAPLGPGDLTPEGLPYGKVCAWCLRHLRARAA